MHKFHYDVKLYAGAKHPGVVFHGLKEGDLVLHTAHGSAFSKDIEVFCAVERMKHGEILKIEVVSRNDSKDNVTITQPADWQTKIVVGTLATPADELKVEPDPSSEG